MARVVIISGTDDLKNSNLSNSICELLNLEPNRIPFNELLKLSESEIRSNKVLIIDDATRYSELITISILKNQNPEVVFIIETNESYGEKSVMSCQINQKRFNVIEI